MERSARKYNKTLTSFHLCLYVFLTVTGPAQCNVCLERNAASCSDNQQVQICGIDPYSLGTTHCGTAVGTYRDSKGDIVHGFFRGCINCAGRYYKEGAFVSRLGVFKNRAIFRKVLL